MDNGDGRAVGTVGALACVDGPRKGVSFLVPDMTDDTRRTRPIPPDMAYVVPHTWPMAVALYDTTRR